MVLPSVTLTSSLLSPSTKTVPCQKVVVSFRRDVNAEPNANPGELAYAQTQAHDNPIYSILGTQFLAGSTNITYTDLLTLGKLNYGASVAPVLTVTYGSDANADGSPETTQPLYAFNASSTSINVVVKDFNFTIDVGDSKHGYRPTATINFIETR